MRELTINPRLKLRLSFAITEPSMIDIRGCCTAAMPDSTNWILLVNVADGFTM